MIYNCLKILHILSAAILLAGMGYSFHLWRYIQSPRDGAVRSQRILTLTWLIIAPLAIVQLTTGFSMLSINNEDLSQLWVSGSIIGFLILVASWFSFIYFLILSQQVEIKDLAGTENSEARTFSYRRIQSMMLIVSGIATLAMVFFMVNKVT